MSNAGRAGRYVKQTEGYSAFIPEFLPPEPSISVAEPELAKLLSKADRALGRLDGSIATLPDHSFFLSMFVRKEAVLSSQIEGTQASLSDVIKAEAAENSIGYPSDVNEVRNYTNALNEGVASLGKLPISQRLICQLHFTLMQNVRRQHQTPGEIRRSQNWIGAQGCSLNDAVFVPPPQHELSQQLGALENFINSNDDIPDLIKIGLIHAQFETIHPFLDGNGRLGRMLITLYLVERKILSHPMLYLSYYFKRHRSEYYDRLQDVRDKGDWESWIKFFLKGVADVSNATADTVKKVLLQRENDRSAILDAFERSAAYPFRLADRLYSLPVTNQNMAAAALSVSYPTANTIIAKLEDIGILKEVTGQQRNRLYIHDQYRLLFEDD